MSYFGLSKLFSIKVRRKLQLQKTTLTKPLIVKGIFRPGQSHTVFKKAVKTKYYFTVRVICYIYAIMYKEDLLLGFDQVY
jgi:hypothetical protein